MSTRTRLAVNLSLWLCAALLPATAALADSSVQTTVEGYLARVALDHVVVAHADGTTTTYRVDQTLTQCFDFRGDKTTCATLAGIGYADRGRVTLLGDLAKRIDLIVLQQ